MTTTRQDLQAAAIWPLARRVVSGLVQPGGPAMAERAIEGGGLGEGGRVVELAPGLGTTTALLLARLPRTWTGVEPDPCAAAHLGRSVAGAGRTVVSAPPDATGLDDGSASVVVADALFCTLTPDGCDRVLAESARLLRAGGRVVLHEIVPVAGASSPAAEAVLGDAGVVLRGVAAWRASLEAAGLVVVGSLTAPLDLRAPAALMREAGPRTALAITREVAADGALRGAATAAREALVRHAPALRSAVIAAEMPLILGMRRPRR